MIALIYPLFSVIALILNIIFQIISVRFLRVHYFKSIVFGFGIGIIFILVASFMVQFKTHFSISIYFISILFIDIMTYSFLSYCYFAFINTSVTAIRIRLLSELNSQQEGMTIDSIIQRYNSKIIIQKRLERLKNNHQIHQIGSKYFSNPSFVSTMALIIEFMKFAVLGKKMRISRRKDIQKIDSLD